MPAKKLIPIGTRFSRLVVIEPLGHRIVGSRKRKFTRCICDCGTHKDVCNEHLTSGHTKSCGCLKKENYSLPTHGLSPGTDPSGTYRVWSGMKSRCSDVNNCNFPDYGGRGIKVCERWMKFENFLADMGLRPSLTLTLDRINNDGNYERGNCRWATWNQQARNRRSTTFYTFNGVTASLIELCERFEKNYDLVCQRITKQQWSLEDAFNKPTRSVT